MGKVIKLQVKKDRYILVDSIDCIADVGIVGDANAKGGDRQVTIMDEAVNTWIAKQPEKGLCSSRFKANITIKGMDTALLQQGTLLNIGEACLEISSISKKCYKEQCKLYSEKSVCPIPSGCYFAKVVKSGKVKVEDLCAIEKESATLHVVKMMK